MKAVALMALALVAGSAQAQETIRVFGNSGPCYSWSGGYKSAGSFTQCNADTILVQQEPPAKAAPAPVPSPKQDYVFVEPKATPIPHKKVTHKPKKPVVCK